MSDEKQAFGCTNVGRAGAKLVASVEKERLAASFSKASVYVNNKIQLGQLIVIGDKAAFMKDLSDAVQGKKEAWENATADVTRFGNASAGIMGASVQDFVNETAQRISQLVDEQVSDGNIEFLDIAQERFVQECIGALQSLD